MTRKIAFALTVLAGLIDLAIVTSVTLNLAWVRTHAAGGQYSTFPMSVRLTYLFQTAFALVVLWFAWKIRNQIKSQSDSNLALVIVVIYAISTFAQLTSKSANEKWNAIPAAIITWGFFTLRKP